MIEITLKGFSEEQIKGLAIQEGWTEMVLTTTESPNYEVPNPESALNYLDRVLLQRVREAIAKYRLTEARLLAESKIKEAQQELKAVEEADKEYVNNLIKVSVDNNIE